ncbi:MAG: ZIP family metal transporter [Archangiaceae bacterium]|nr:ZIP family metal transporter [Archangiaceae bacterium]
MSPLATAAIATTVAAFASMVPSGVLVVLSSNTRRRLLPWLVAFAAGALLAAALVDLLPEALEPPARPREICAVLLAGLLAFFFADLALAHSHNHADHERPTRAVLLLVGDGLHNLVDGVAIAGAFAISTRAGLATTLAVLAHEVPQEAGNVALLIDAGWPARRAFAANLGVQLLGVAGAVGGAALVTQARPWVLAIASASFLYVAVADLIPSLAHGPRGRRLGLAVMLFAGAGIISALHALLGA